LACKDQTITNSYNFALEVVAERGTSIAVYGLGDIVFNKYQDNQLHCTMRCASSYVHHVRICGTLAFLIHSTPDSSFFCDTPPVCVIWANLFPLQSFFFPNDLFSGWLSFFSVHLCSFGNFFFIGLNMNYYFRSLIPRHVSTPTLLIGRRLVRPYSRQMLFVAFS
jgi:hypothetical protein